MSTPVRHGRVTWGPRTVPGRSAAFPVPDPSSGPFPPAGVVPRRVRARGRARVRARGDAGGCGSRGGGSGLRGPRRGGGRRRGRGVARPPLPRPPARRPGQREQAGAGRRRGAGGTREHRRRQRRGQGEEDRAPCTGPASAVPGSALIGLWAAARSVPGGQGLGGPLRTACRARGPRGGGASGSLWFSGVLLGVPVARHPAEGHGGADEARQHADAETAQIRRRHRGQGRDGGDDRDEHALVGLEEEEDPARDEDHADTDGRHRADPDPDPDHQRQRGERDGDHLDSARDHPHRGPERTSPAPGAQCAASPRRGQDPVEPVPGLPGRLRHEAENESEHCPSPSLVAVRSTACRNG